jgi:hypothetical protein
MISCLFALLFILMPKSEESWRSCLTVKADLVRQISASGENEEHELTSPVDRRNFCQCLQNEWVALGVAANVITVNYKAMSHIRAVKSEEK